ncbi:MAG: spore coat protein U domain-containing protein, partial [Steroidobacteraceae bacterium]
MKFLAGAMAVALLFAAPAARAACVGVLLVSATPVSFLTYDPLSATPKTAVGTITVGCVGLGLLPNATIKLSSGTSSSFAPRTMKSGIHTLNYNLYTDTGAVWGDGSPGTAV